MFSNDLRRQNYRQSPTPSTQIYYIFKSTYVAYYSRESPVDIGATDAPRHSSREVEDQLFSVILYMVYDSSQLGFFFLIYFYIF